MQTATIKWIGEEKFLAISPSGHAIAVDSDRAATKAPGLLENVPSVRQFPKFLVWNTKEGAPP